MSLFRKLCELAGYLADQKIERLRVRWNWRLTQWIKDAEARLARLKR